ncbi:c-type cytochrome biogenesis protein CcmI [Roseibium aggregatum]|uniref:C-type cytochrome biogenesis protein CcmI n=1 Tax=Roseibium aggregatum TaxID=187304 RepID=A0A939ECV1_9HYPH|nr:c-type cytochrome biogenesis protein CcmI [Roseibium aggregatum]MBN9670862.1 c-type cytochrome biogenesis protein CcmI [Roseibium aggregatum]
MTSFWIFSALAIVISAIWLALPFLRRTEAERDETDAALSIYRDQLDEVHRDLEAELISQSESEAAEREIEARALQAARRSVGGMSISHRSPVFALGIAVAMIAGSFAGYAWLGTPGSEDRPLFARKTEALVKKAEAGDIKSRIQLLLETVEKHPDSFEDWWLLARSYAATGDNASAADAYRRAAELSENDPGVLSAYAEAMTLANGNKVPTAAKILFQQIRDETNDPRARYYLALAKAQGQDFEGALTDWAALAADSDPNAPWMALVRRDIVNMARFTESDLEAYLPDATPAETAKAAGRPIENDKDALEARAETLDEKLAKDPADYKSWQELAQIRAALGDTEKAKAAIETARKRFAAAPFLLSKINATAANLGLDLIAASKETKGPTEDDIAAAQSLTADEQADMIEGMVAGLAAKLEENPDNPDGWVMLVRSYSHLGEREKAEAALAKAEDHYSSDPTVLARIKKDVRDLVN